MSFDIRELFFDFDTLSIDDERMERYQAELLDRFSASPEFQRLLEAGEITDVHWTGIFLDLAMREGKLLLFVMRQPDLREVLYDGFPYKVIAQPEDASTIIAELRAFWEFLKREFSLENADKILKVLNEKNIVKRLEKELASQEKYGLSKSVFMPGIAEGLDMTDEDAVQQYIEDYNARMQAEFEEMMNTPIPRKVLEKRDKIIEITAAVLTEHLGQEYADLAQEMATQIAQVKPNSPLERGKVKTWAAGIAHALAMVNLAYAEDADPHIELPQLARHFGVSASTARNKGEEIINNMGLLPLDPDWVLPSQRENNPWDEIRAMFTEPDGSPLDILMSAGDIDSELYLHPPSDQGNADETPDNVIPFRNKNQKKKSSRDE